MAISKAAFRKLLHLAFCTPLFFFAQHENYFQQEVNYRIEVSLDDKAHILNAFEEIEYINNSPDTLTFLWFHLWPNAYSGNQTALARQMLAQGELQMKFGKPEEMGGIDQLDFKIDGTAIKTENDKKNPDLCKLFLNKSLPPGGKIKITTPFRVKIPSALFSRLGHLDQSYAITQWYPKPAVYDKNGWNQMPYLGQGEFYSEWGNFDVKITLPENYVVGATGDLEDGEKETAWLKQKVKRTLNKAAYRSQLIKAGVPVYDSLAYPASSPNFKTLHYKQKNVHDFAWFADKRFNVLHGIVELPNNKREVNCWALFTDNQFELWMRSIEYLSDATYFYSLWNGDYQYNHVSAVDGTISAGSGMEYPNITIIGEAQDDYDLENVIMHEVGHNWFYGMLGSNEREHAWMDEGINSFNELRYMRTKYNGAITAGAIIGRDSSSLLGIWRFSNSFQYYYPYMVAARQNLDQALELSSPDFEKNNYGTMVYGKTAIAFDYLFHYMGEKKFDEAMRFYFENFRFKHPYPEDLKKTLEFFNGKSLSWFFDDLIGSTKKLNYKIVKHKTIPGGAHQVLVRNTGDIKGPVMLCGVKNNKLRGLVWYDGFNGEKWLEFPQSEIDEFVIDQMFIMPEVKRSDNRIRTSGLFKRAEPLQIRMLGMIEDPRKTQLFLTPVPAYNPYNGFMAGVYINNTIHAPKLFEFDLLPLYDFKNKQLCGNGNAQFNFYTKSAIRKISIGSNLKRYAFDNEIQDLSFNRMENFADITFKKKKVAGPFEHSVRFSHIMTITDGLAGDYNFSPPIYTKVQTSNQFARCVYTVKKEAAFNGWSVKTQFEGGQIEGADRSKDHFAKLSGEFKFHWSMNKKNQGFDFRVFAGTMLQKSNNGNFNFRMGGITGNRDYTYDHFYFARSEQSNGLFALQYAEEEGAFKTRMLLGQSSEYLLALNIKTPRILNVIGFYADFGTCGKDGLLKQQLLFDAGININIIQDCINIYIPLTYSEDMKSTITANGWSFAERIRFTFKLQELHPKKLIKYVIPI